MRKTVTSIVYLSLLCMTGFSNASHALAADVEYNLRAAILYKIGKYLSWQPPVVNINYCFIGDRGEKISQVLSEKINAGKIKKVKLTNIKATTSSEMASCDVLYYDSSELSPDFVDNIPESLFTITNDSMALNKGFVISIEIEERKPRLTLSRSNLENKSIKVDSRFLSIVTIVD